MHSLLDSPWSVSKCLDGFLQFQNNLFHLTRHYMFCVQNRKNHFLRITQVIRAFRKTSISVLPHRALKKMETTHKFQPRNFSVHVLVSNLFSYAYRHIFYSSIGSLSHSIIILFFHLTIYHEYYFPTTNITHSIWLATFTLCYETVVSECPQ